MMRSFSSKEKSVIKQLVDREEEVFTISDVIGFQWVYGRFEMSTFYQLIRVHMKDSEEMELVMRHLMEVLAIVKWLESKGYISGWNQVPTEDNMVEFGDQQDDFTAYFLPDLSLATETLKYGNRKFYCTESMRDLLKTNFKASITIRHQSLVKTITTGFVVLGFVVCLGFYFHGRHIGERLESHMESQSLNQAELLENQLLNRQVIDSINQDSRELMMLTKDLVDRTEGKQILTNQYLSKQKIDSIYSRSERLLLLSQSFVLEVDSL